MKGNLLLIALISVLIFATLHTSHTNTQQFQELREENVILYEMLDSVLHTAHTNAQQLQELKEENATLRTKIDSKLRQSSKPKATAPAPAPKSNKSAAPASSSNTGRDENNAPANVNTKQRIVVTSKYRIEDRYVRHKIENPELKGNQVGEIVINILVNSLGDVKSAEIGSITGITDEDVIEACKKAALRTGFNYDSDQAYGTKIPGTITYTFSSK
jgi:hypothetical protein